MKFNIFRKFFNRLFGQATKEIIIRITYKDDHSGFTFLRVPKDAIEPKIGDIIESFTLNKSTFIKITGAVYEHMDMDDTTVYYWVEYYLGVEVYYWEYQNENRKIEKDNNE
jgi:hypothetical protein